MGRKIAAVVLALALLALGAAEAQVLPIPCCRIDCCDGRPECCGAGPEMAVDAVTPLVTPQPPALPFAGDAKARPVDAVTTLITPQPPALPLATNVKAHPVDAVTTLITPQPPALPLATNAKARPGHRASRKVDAGN